MGPDIVDVVLCTWLNVAIPAILNGCDFIPFCETRIVEIEKIQSQVAKFALGVSKTTNGTCAQSELGMKSFRQHLFERQLKFYLRILYLPASRWVHQALLEHLSGVWPSPYMNYIFSLRSRLCLLGIPKQFIDWKHQIYAHFLNVANVNISHLHCIKQLKTFVRQPYVCESEWSTVISEFKLENEGLGNKQPRNGRPRKPYCPVCPMKFENSGFHLLFCCSSLAKLRAESGISTFIMICAMKGVSLYETFVLYINGLSSEKKSIGKSAHLERGKAMFDMRKKWHSLW